MNPLADGIVLLDARIQIVLKKAMPCRGGGATHFF